jgi:hypothetical protein
MKTAFASLLATAFILSASPILALTGVNGHTSEPKMPLDHGEVIVAQYCTKSGSRTVTDATCKLIYNNNRKYAISIRLDQLAICNRTHGKSGKELEKCFGPHQKKYTKLMSETKTNYDLCMKPCK